MWTGAFWKAALERAVKTFAQALVAVLGIGVTGLLDVNWGAAFSAAGLAAVISLLTSVASYNVGNNKGPSLANEQVPEVADTPTP